MLRDLSRLAETWSPDVVVHEEGEFAAPLFAAMRGIPCVTNSWPAPARPESELSVFRTLLEPIWAANGVTTPARTSGDRYLDACPPAFQSKAIDSISSVVPIRPVMFDGPSTSEPPWLTGLPRPAAYVSFGTVGVMSTPELLRLVTDALEPVFRAVVVTTGPNTPDVLGARPGHVHVEQYLPQSLILPHVDMVVSHGGAGTTLGCVLSALPHLVIPGTAFSQNRNAAQTDAMGMGVALSRADVSVDAVREAAQAIIADPAYQQAASGARAGLDDMLSLDAAVDLLECLTASS
jgi:UDP:flavonoid glycosyltransferase YjiC (YdhE family)